MERDPNSPEYIERVQTGAFVGALFQIGRIAAKEMIVRDVPEGRLWHAAVDVVGEDVDSAIEAMEPGQTGTLLAQLYRDRIIGHWIVTGLNSEVSTGFRFDTEMQQAAAFTLAENYLRGRISDEG